jgi:endonuclease/exonuclease/phosphatase family metal-dependent hydrolase
MLMSAGLAKAGFADVECNSNRQGPHRRLYIHGKDVHSLDRYRGHKRPTIMTLGIVLLAAALVASAAQAGEPHTFKLLTYNVHGLHSIAAQDSPKKRTLLIGHRVASEYDIALLQEDFVYPERIARTLSVSSQPYDYHRGNSSTVKAGFSQRLGQILLWLPAKLFLGTDMPHGSGLTTVAYRRDGFSTAKLVRKPYKICDGLFGAKNDCLAAKGYLAVRLTGPDGIEVDLWNTHLDAPGKDSNRGVRRKQLAQLTRAVQEYSGDRALIVAGDFNSRLQQRKDHLVLHEFQSRHGLIDVAARRDETWHRGADKDYILYRSGLGTEVTLPAKGYGEDPEFRWHKDRRRMSDHPALFANFEISQAD